MNGKVKKVVFSSTYQQLESLNKICNKGASTQTEAIQLLLDASQIINQFPHYDVIGMEALADRLRHELRHIHERTDGIDSINKLSMKIRVSRPYLAKFRDGGMVCMNIMNRIATAFDIRYIIENYDDPQATEIK